MQERVQAYSESPDLVRNIINEGSEKARDEARRTLDEVNHVLGLDYQ
jgi:tryptophanyl-tRNA synthetase